MQAPSGCTLPATFGKHVVKAPRGKGHVEGCDPGMLLKVPYSDFLRSASSEACAHGLCTLAHMLLVSAEDDDMPCHLR